MAESNFLRLRSLSFLTNIRDNELLLQSFYISIRSGDIMG